MITNSTLSGITQSQRFYNRAMSTENSDVTLMNNTFANNKAVQGAAILFT